MSYFPASFNRLAAANLAAQSAEQLSLAAVPLVAVRELHRAGRRLPFGLEVVGFAEDAENYLMLVRVQPGRSFTYYAGSAWSRGLDFPDRESWERHVTEQKLAF